MAAFIGLYIISSNLCGEIPMGRGVDYEKEFQAKVGTVPLFIYKYLYKIFVSTII